MKWQTVGFRAHEKQSATERETLALYESGSLTPIQTFFGLKLRGDRANATPVSEKDVG